MTDKKLKNYGVEVTEKANIAMSLLKQKGIVFPEDMEKELNCNWELYFRAGYAAAVEAMEIEKKKKAEKKNKKFDIYDFVDLKKYKGLKSYHFLEGVFYDDENKKMVTTNGIYMVYCNSTIPAGYKNKIVDKNGVFIDGRFPNWRKVMPDNKDIEKQADSDSIKQAIIDFSSKYNLSLAACEKWCEKNTIGGPYEVIKDKLYLTPKMAKYIVKFMTTQKTLSFYAYKDDKLTFDGKLYQRKYERTWVIEGDNATMIFMPCKFPEAEEAA